MGPGGLTLFPDTELYREAESGTFDYLDERGLTEELLLFLDNLDFKGRLITHHTSSMNLNTMNFGKDKKRIVEALRKEMDCGDIDQLARLRSMKTGL